MPDFSDPIWSIIATISTIFSAIVAIVATVIAFFQLIQNKKRLTFFFDSITPILSIQPDYKEQLEILFNGIPVNDVYVIKIIFRNAGRTPIRSSEYDRPIKVLFINGTIMQANIMKTQPKDLGNILLSIDRSSITIEKTLLNPKDNFEINVLINGFTGDINDIKVDARIEGINEITYLRTSGFGITLTEVLLKSISIGNLGLIAAEYILGKTKEIQPEKSRNHNSLKNELIFREYFNEETVNTKIWKVYQNEGFVHIKSGELILETIKPTKSFPYITTYQPIFPKQQNFLVRFGIQYTNVGLHGAGIIMCNTTPENLSTTDIAGYRVWQDSNLRMPEDLPNSSPDLAYHDIEFRFENEFDECFIDGRRIYKKRRENGIPVPSTILIGNHAKTASEQRWSEFKIRYIEVMKIN